MSPSEALLQHQQLCDELHQLALEENRFLKQNQRVPDAALLERKKVLLGRLEQSLEGLRKANILLSAGGDTPSGIDREVLERTRARIMQILHLDKENEQLLFRYSLGAPQRPPAIQPPPSQLQRMYGSQGGKP
jgi:hypothetical protein